MHAAKKFSSNQLDSAVNCSEKQKVKKAKTFSFVSARQHFSSVDSPQNKKQQLSLKKTSLSLKITILRG